jgi:hypothetical protein
MVHRTRSVPSRGVPFVALPGEPSARSDAASTNTLRWQTRGLRIMALQRGTLSVRRAANSGTER